MCAICQVSGFFTPNPRSLWVVVPLVNLDSADVVF